MNKSMGTSVLDELPEPIIQHILSFLTAREAAQTTLLSNSWRSAGLTQPNLAFCGRIEWDSARRTYCSPVLELARKTIQRYEESNLKIQSLTLRVDRGWDDFLVLCKELIAKSLKLGATHLNLNLGDIDFVLPHDIVFGSEKLVGLSVQGSCKIVKKRKSKVIRCSGLESLCLMSTHISLDTLSNIISSCPSIRKFSLSDIKEKEEEVVINRSVGLGLMSLHSLTCLELVYVKFDTLFLGDMSSRFPSLKDLTLHHLFSSGEEEIRISSRSLKNFFFRNCDERERFKFDVPSIRRFTYNSSVVTLLSFESTSREWESRVSIEPIQTPTDSFWFRRLNDFLSELRTSKIHLSFIVGCRESFDYVAGEMSGDLRMRPMVENLTVHVDFLPSLSCYAFFDGLFLSCRPKFITQCLHRGKANNEYFLCKTLVERVRNGKCSDQSHFMYHGLLDLEGVKVAIFDKAVGVWRDVPFMESLLDDDDERKIRFHFKWKC